MSTPEVRPPPSSKGIASASKTESRSPCDPCINALLDQIVVPVERFIADGAYGGSPSRDLLASRLGEIVEVIILPPKTAVASPQSTLNPTVRDRHIAEIEARGRMA